MTWKPISTSVYNADDNCGTGAGGFKEGNTCGKRESPFDKLTADQKAIFQATSKASDLSEEIDRSYTFSSERPASAQRAREAAFRGDHKTAAEEHKKAVEFHNKKISGRKHGRTGKPIGKETLKKHREAAKAHEEAALLHHDLHEETRTDNVESGYSPNDAERRAFPEIPKRRKRIRLRQSDSGFIYEV